MPILTASQDMLKYDPLKAGDMDNVDPLGKAASRRIKTYDEDLGYAVHPEERDAANQYRSNVDAEASTQQGALDTYKTDYASSIAAADEQAQGLLGQFQDIPGQDTIDVNLSHMSDDIEGGTFRVNRAWAEDYMEKNFPNSNFRLDESTGRYTVDGWIKDPDNPQNMSVPDKELYLTLKAAQDQTNTLDDEYTAMQGQVTDARTAAELEIASQRGIAAGTYGQNVSQAETNIQATRDLWTNYQTSQREAFLAARESNAGGIKELVDSGALIVTGSIQ